MEDVIASSSNASSGVVDLTTSSAPDDDVQTSPAPPSSSSADNVSSSTSSSSSARHRKSISDVPENVANACCTPAAEAEAAQNLTSDVNCNDFLTKTGECGTVGQFRAVPVGRRCAGSIVKILASA